MEKTPLANTFYILDNGMRDSNAKKATLSLVSILKHFGTIHLLEILFFHPTFGAQTYNR